MLKSAALLLSCTFIAFLGCAPGGSHADGGSGGPDAGPPVGYIPGGTFQMGSTSGSPAEAPVTTVTLTPYALDRTEVTVTDYAACVAGGKCTEPGLPTNGWCNWHVSGKEGDPINCVSWSQARNYCEAQGKRLPTEAEWEFGARGTDGRRFPWGNSAPPAPSSDSTLVQWGPGLGFTTAPVGTHPDGVSPFGLQDMAGNVWEWVEDEHRDYPGGAVTNPLYEETFRSLGSVARGGSWFESESQLRTTERMFVPDAFQSPTIGFRCAQRMSWGPVDAESPLAASFFIVKARTTTSVTLSWDPVADLDGVALYSAATPDSATPTEQILPASSSFEIMQPYTGVAAYYWIRLKTKAGLGPPSRVLRASPLAPAPTGVTTKSDLRSVTLSWDPVAVPVRGYQVYKNGQEWSPTGADMTSFEDGAIGPGVTATYEVASLGPDLFAGPRSAVITAGAGKATAVVAGADHWCALGEDKTAWCWGPNVAGGVGDGSSVTAFKGHRVVGPDGTGYLSEVKAIAPGGGFTCALKTDGSVWCWGSNNKGQLGNESTTDSLVPVQVHGIGGLPFGGVDQIEAGSQHTCVVKTSGGAVYCWGDNATSALGASTFSGTYRTTPIAVSGANGVGTLTGAVSLSVGAGSACITKANHSVWCWGGDGSGQLGDNQPDTNGSAQQMDRAFAVQVVGPEAVGTLSATEVSVGLYQACAVGMDSGVYCWGHKSPGDFTANDLEPIHQRHYWGVHYPVAVPDLTGSGTLMGVSGLGGLWHHYCGVTPEHFAVCWEENPNNVLLDGSGVGHPWPSLSTVGGIQTIAPGVEASCGLFTDGSVRCWGSNTYGALGDGTTTAHTEPVSVLYE